MKERVNYTIEKNGDYVGACVNLPIVVQAKSFEEMDKQIRMVAYQYVTELHRMLELQEPFEYKQTNTP